MPDKWGWTLEEFIEGLLRLGKRRKDPEFQGLIAVYGEAKIVEKANAILAKWKSMPPDEDKE